MSELKQSSTESSGTHAPESHGASPEEEARAKQKAGQVALKKTTGPSANNHLLRTVSRAYILGTRRSTLRRVGGTGKCSNRRQY